VWPGVLKPIQKIDIIIILIYFPKNKNLAIIIIIKEKYIQNRYVFFL
jgi:hypothetical protein